MSDRRLMITIVVLTVLVAVLSNVIGGHTGPGGQTVALIVGEILMLFLAIWGIRSANIYSDRVYITKRKFISGLVTGLVVLTATLAVEDVVIPKSVEYSMGNLLRQPHAIASTVLTTALAMLLIGVAEELLFRGYLFEYASRKFSGRIGFVLSVASIGILFGACHTVHDYVLMSANHVPFHTIIKMYVFQYSWGIFGCLLYAYSKNIVYLMVLHGLIDSSLGNPLVSHFEFLYVFIVLAFVISYFSRIISAKTNRVPDKMQFR